MELPVLFTDYTRNLLGDEDYMRLTAALESEQPVSIRLIFSLGRMKFPGVLPVFILKNA